MEGLVYTTRLVFDLRCHCLAVAFIRKNLMKSFISVSVYCFAVCLFVLPLQRNLIQNLQPVFAHSWT